MNHHEKLRVVNLVKYFPIYGGIFSREIARINAVRGVSFNVKAGETVGLVGESGCGKSTLARTIVRLYKLDEGEIFYNNISITSCHRKELKNLRREMQMIFQDPYASLNPRMTVGDIIGEPFIIHKIAKGKVKQEGVEALLSCVGLSNEAINKYPHEFSGGQRQRIGIARALAVKPKFIICDEPVSALDVSIQAQIINLLIDLQERFNLTYLFISHDLKVVRHISSRVIVMYLGKIMELINSDKIFTDSSHPYTKALLSAIPIQDPTTKKKRLILEGDVPSSINPPKGCPFNTRCFMKQDICFKEEPLLRNIYQTEEHLVSCHFVQ